MEQRCTGHCCEEFVIRHDEDKWNRDWVATWLGDHESGEKILDDDVLFLLKMLVPLDDVVVEKGLDYTTFTCKYFKGGDCTIYKDRPQMCRTYPDGEKCAYEGCTYVGPGGCSEIEQCANR